MEVLQGNPRSADSSPAPKPAFGERCCGAIAIFSRGEGANRALLLSFSNLCHRHDGDCRGRREEEDPPSHHMGHRGLLPVGYYASAEDNRH